MEAVFMPCTFCGTAALPPEVHRCFRCGQIVIASQEYADTATPSGQLSGRTMASNSSCAATTARPRSGPHHLLEMRVQRNMRSLIEGFDRQLPH